jgi:hypothetical protein
VGTASLSTCRKGGAGKVADLRGHRDELAGIFFRQRKAVAAQAPADLAPVMTKGFTEKTGHKYLPSG